MSPGAAAEFTEFYTAHYARVLRFLERRVSDPETARELAADAFRIAWSRYAESAPKSPAWIFVVARNLVGEEYRRRERHGEAMQRLRTELDVADQAHPVDTAAVHAALARLEADQAELLRLAYWDGLAGSELAGMLGISTSAVWVRLHRARRAFSAALTSLELETEEVDHE